MNAIKKGIYILVMIGGSVFTITSRNIDKMPSDYWYTGKMYVISQAFPDLEYKIHFWDNKTKTYKSNDARLSVNRQGLSIRDLWNLDTIDQLKINDGSQIVFEPMIPYIGGIAETAQDFEKSVKKGQKAPYFVVTRVGQIINFYILGPTFLNPYQVSKISFNTVRFERDWVRNTDWYKKSKKPLGISLGCSFNAAGIFLNDKNKMYIYGLNSKTEPIKTSSNWLNSTTQKANGKTLTISELKRLNVFKEQNGLDPEEYNSVIGIINASKAGEFPKAK